MNKKSDQQVLLKAMRLIYQCDKRAIITKAVYVTLLSLLPLANLYVMRYMIDGITAMVAHGAEGSSMLNYILLFCGIFLVTRLIHVFNTVNNDVLTQKLIDYINNIIQTQSVRLDMSYYDNPEYHDSFHRAQQEAAYRPVRILEDVANALGAAISLAGIVAILCTTSWKVILVMTVAVLPAFIVRLYKSRRIYRFRRETTQQSRRCNYYGQLLTSKPFAQEVRSFGLQGYFRNLYVEVRRMLVGTLYRISRQLAIYDGITAVIETAALFFIICILLKPAVDGLITIGTFVMLFEAFRRGQGYMQSLVSSISGLYENKLFIGNLYEFLALKPQILSPASPVPFPKEASMVEFCDVSFGYLAGSGGAQHSKVTPVLNHFNFTARRGEITRIEGENGFGKTTALKLLLRLYDVNEGSIRIDGTDIRQFSLKELRHAISVIFQDHVRFYFSAKENVEFGDIAHRDDPERLERALHLSEAQPVVDTLSCGLDTPLGRQFDNGEELSTGQWQRIALARQLYSNAPILVFDEPTAWMDTPSRNKFFQHLEEIKKDHIVILIAHI